MKPGQSKRINYSSSISFILVIEFSTLAGTSSYISFLENTQKTFVLFYFIPAEWGNNTTGIIQFMSNSRTTSCNRTVANKEANTLCLPVIKADVHSVWLPTFVTCAISYFHYTFLYLVYSVFSI
jgi:hypothetical protein